MQEGLKLINNNSGVILCKYGRYNETDHNISITTYSPEYDKFSKGDIYFRGNPNKQAVRVQVFNGQNDNFYDQNFGAGSRTHGALVVDISRLLGIAEKNYPDLYDRLKIAVKKTLNIDL